MKIRTNKTNVLRNLIICSFLESLDFKPNILYKYINIYKYTNIQMYILYNLNLHTSVCKFKNAWNFRIQ